MKQNEKAKAWRIGRGLSLDELAKLTGYSVPAIYKFEAGYRQDGRQHWQHSEWVWQRYRMACAGVDAQLRSGKAFEW